MIEAKDIYFTYPNGRQALKNLSLKINDFPTVIIGPNGAGKTTLLKILALIYKPDAGNILINGDDYWNLPKKRQIEIRREIVYLHEKPTLFSKTVLENIMYPLLIRGYSKKEAKEKALNWIKELGIEYLKDRHKKHLSAGESQLVAFVRATIIKPKYLLLDEPTNTLDQEKRDLIETLVKKLIKDGTKIIIVTHDILLALKLAKKIILLSNTTEVREINRNHLLTKILKHVENI